VSFTFGKLEIFVHYIFYKQWAHINKTRAFIHSNRPRQAWVWIILFWCFAGHNFRALKSSIRCTTWRKCWWRQSCSCAHCDRRKQSMKQFCFQSKIAVQLLIRNIWYTKEIKFWSDCTIIILVYIDISRQMYSVVAYCASWTNLNLCCN